MSTQSPFKPGRVALAGATGTIGRAVLETLLEEGWDVACLGRRSAEEARADWRQVDVTDAPSIERDGFRGEPFDAIVSCLASRSGVAGDAWAIDYGANAALLAAAKEAGVGHFVLLSAICVQKPKLAFQHAKLAFEADLQGSRLSWSIVRPTAFFKSLSGQVARVQSGKPYLVFGDGTLTACKPISDHDLARYISGCLTDPARRDKILPIGGPGPALTPRDMGNHLFERLGKPPRFASMPVWGMRAIAGSLGAAGTLVPQLAAKAELARIGLYYGTESMLVWDAEKNAYDAEATPEFGSDTLLDHFDAMLAGNIQPERGAHSVF